MLPIPLLPDLRVRQRDYLLQIARAMTQDLDLDSLLTQILKTSVDLLAGQVGLIALRSPESGWRVQVSQNMPPAFLRSLEPMLAKIPGEHDPEKDELPEINRLLNEFTYAASMGQLSGVGLPLITRQKVVGVIFVFRTYSTVFSSNDRVLLSSFANQAAIAVQNAQLVANITREKQRLDALLGAVADGVLILKPNLDIDRANDAFCRLMEIEEKSIIGIPHQQVIVWDKSPQGTKLEDAVENGWPLTPHATLYVEGDINRGKNVAPLPTGVTYAPLMTPDGVLLNIIASVRDITKFRQADELKSTFVSIVSHELKTPVALIKGYVSTLRREDASWDRQIVSESLQVIEEEADRLSGLIENLLDASRLQAGGIALKRSEVSIPVLAERMAKRFQTQTTTHTIVVDFPENFPVIVADEGRLEQLISNLIGNAIKYAPDGEVKIHGQVRKNMVIVSVSDQGPGISTEDLPHVFDRFYRARDMARHTKGAGLGLYLAKTIVEAHGGRIWVESGLEKGAHIYFSLPITE
jgi:K+-sensing histidine kinase KdpD